MKLIVFSACLNIFAFGNCLIEVPSAFWCDNANLSSKYETVQQCSDYKTSIFDKPIKLTLLYESLCPGCRRFITTILYTQIFQRGNDFVEIELVPYGNAHRNRLANGTVQITCQHGADECTLNKLHSCAISELVTVDRWLPFIFCLENSTDPMTSVNDCFKASDIKKTEQKLIKKCHTGPKGDQLQTLMADRTDAVWPDKHKWVPWIMINNVSTHDMQFYLGDTLMNLLCVWYKGSKVPKNCPAFMNNFNRQASFVQSELFWN